MRRHSHLRTAALRLKRCPPTNAPHVAVQPPPQGRPSRGATHGVAQALRTRKQRGPREMHSSRADTPPIMHAAEACPLSPVAPTPRRPGHYTAGIRSDAPRLDLPVSQALDHATTRSGSVGVGMKGDWLASPHRAGALSPGGQALRGDSSSGVSFL
ncbi:hypothetical protein Q4I32_005741 [Leishmania shawi]|uniref:Uncharacterized protein n=1 Tax=Leishmania shawi TaxID=5680 RepID=A0AAW3BHR3_9TRYP